MEIKMKEDFSALVRRVQGSKGYETPQAWGLAICTLDSNGNTLDALFPYPNYDENFGAAAIFYDATSFPENDTVTFTADAYARACDSFSPFADEEGHANIDCMHSLWKACKERKGKHPKTAILKIVFIYDLDEPPQGIEDAYLRLHLISSRKVKPNEINLDCIFGILPNNAWTSEGPISPADLPKRQMEARARLHPLHIYSVDKFPRMVDYVVPSGVRIADASRVRLGAYLGEGTTVMHEGFVNFNAGTLGASMVEGRISAGVVIGNQTDIGGGASIMGTLSGGGKTRVVIGRGCLLGANSGIGISLGDKCVVEAGLYVTAGMPVLYRDKVVLAIQLSGKDGLTFIRHSQTGQVVALDKPNGVVLNDELHSN